MLLTRCVFVQDSVCAAFHASSHYADTFEVFLKFYHENESLDLEKLRTEEQGKLSKLENSRSDQPH